ncbi:AraC family transcriptional regulator [Ferrovibrio sp.]|uniref:AraC family transcriptional regulator n=1 Tax=Ferrovibrio sp. TaxID=1917215 RepID=UPI00262AD256|nr:AraC family transcriptional regulator [Ferrovibrio sp.]
MTRADSTRGHSTRGRIPRSVAAGYVRTLLDAVRDGTARPAAPDQVLAEAGLPPALLDTAEGRLPHDAVSAIWQAAQRLTGDSHLGLHVGEQVRPGSFDALGHLLMSCETLREAAAQADRFAPLVGGGGRFAARTESDAIRLLYMPFDPDWPCRRQRVEAVLTATLTFTRWLCGRRIAPHSVRFRHAAPDSLAEYRRIFAAPVQFEAEDDSMLLPDDILALPVRQASPALKGMLADYAGRALARLSDTVDEDALRSRLADCIRGLLANGNAPSIDAAAADLGMTPRTLQRRLAERGTGFQDEVAALRCAMAKELLRDPDRSMATVAARLGFADVANFHRAFKAWTGATPAQWRDTGQGQA